VPIINWHPATVMPITQAFEIEYITDFSGMAVRTSNSEFFQTKRENPGENGEIRTLQVKLKE